MGRTWRGAAGLSAVAVLSLLGACSTGVGPSGRGAGQHACGPARKAEQFFPEPSVVGVQADGHGAGPGTIAERVDLDELVELARSGPSREQGEQFALRFAQAVMDSREQVDEQRLVDALMADEVPGAACEHVLTRLPSMRRIGWDVFVVPDFATWLRSRAEGDPDEPSRIELELIMVVDLERDPMLFGVPSTPSAYRVRVDVVRVDDVWLVADWQGPESGGFEHGEQPRDKPYGAGWRSWEQKVE